MDNSDGSLEIARIYGTDGLSPCMNAHAGDTVPKMVEVEKMEYEVVAERGRAYRGQAPQLEVNKEGIANTVTTVEKDNMVLEMGHIEKGTGDHQSNRVYSEEGCAPSICAMTGVKQPPAMHVEVRQATKDGYIQCEIGGGGGSELSRFQNSQRKGARERTDMPNSDNGEYP